EVDDGVRAAIVSIAEQFPTYGYRMITEERKRRTFAVNSKRVRRLMHEENLVIAVHRYVTTSTCARDRRDWPNLLKNEPITKLNEAWAAEIVYSQMTKPAGLAGRSYREHITDLDVVPGHYNSVDEQLDELPFLLERRIIETLSHPFCKRFCRRNRSA